MCLIVFVFIQKALQEILEGYFSECIYVQEELLQISRFTLELANYCTTFFKQGNVSQVTWDDQLPPAYQLTLAISVWKTHGLTTK